MTHPLFKEGEEVILCSKEQPEDNGEYVVERILNSGELYICRITGKRCIDNYSQFCYLLNPPVPKKSNKYGVEPAWHESALRKKYPPADKEFTEELKNMLTGNTSSSKMNTSKQ